MNTSIKVESSEFFEPIPLTAHQIKFWDELGRDEKAAKLTLEIAIQYHTNFNNELSKRSDAWWKDFIKTHNLSNLFVYDIKFINNTVCAIKVEKDTP